MAAPQAATSLLRRHQTGGFEISAGSANTASGAKARAEVRMVVAKNILDILFPIENRSARCRGDVHSYGSKRIRAAMIREMVFYAADFFRP